MNKISKHAVIVFLLWAFAPLAWFLMWRDKKYHTWFPKLLWINGIIFGVIFVTQSVIAVPKLNELYRLVGIEVPAYVNPFAVTIIIFFALAQIYAGVQLEKKVRVKKQFAEKFMALIILIFAIDGILGIVTGFITTITPAAFLKSIYNKTVSTSDSPSPSPENKFILEPKLSPTPSPTPSPLTFSQMNQKYGPCVNVPVVMYHHVEEFHVSSENHRTGLAVTPEQFVSQLTYLSQRGYEFVFPSAISDFFDNGAKLPAKPIVLTFDDGYDDFYFNVLPVLKQFDAKAVLFLPTGLTGNPGYINWSQVDEVASSGRVYIANHSWSHAGMTKDENKDRFEITTADRELNEKGLNKERIFAYPYGTISAPAQKILGEINYKLGFTTQPGRVLCKQNRLTLPRVRIGSAPLVNYGL